MTFINSSDIKVYPASSRGVGSELPAYNGNPESKLFTENNIVGLINRLAKIRQNTNKSDSAIEINHSFVISDSFNANSPFEICIDGYYFVINSMNAYISNFENDNDIYAKIIVKNKSASYTINELAGYLTDKSKVVDDLDTNTTNGQFIALSLENTSELSTYEDCTSYGLHILTKNNGSWIIPPTSKIIITADYVGLSDYNGVLHNLYEYFEKDNKGNLIIKQANKLQNTKTLWGQTFDGTQNVSGNLTSVENITPTFSNTYDIGAKNNTFKNVYANDIEATSTITANGALKSNSIQNNITSGSTNTSKIGESSSPFNDGYFNNLTANTEITTSKLYASDGTSCNIGKENTPFNEAYVTTTYTDNIQIKDDYNITSEAIGSENKKPTNIYATTFNGNATSSSKWNDARKITISGDAEGDVYIDGSNDVTLNLDVKTSAKLDSSTDVGSSIQPVYFEGGVPKSTSYCLKANVEGNATTSQDGLMSKNDKSKLDGIDTNANNYTLPGATSSSLGGVKLEISNGILTIKNY